MLIQNHFVNDHGLIIQIVSQIYLCFVFYFSPVLACSGCYIWKYPWRMDHWPFGTQRHHHGVCFTFWAWLASHCFCSKSNDAVFWPCHQWHGMWHGLSCSSSKFWKYCEACWLFICIKVHIFTRVSYSWYYYYYPLVSLKYTFDRNNFSGMSVNSAFKWLGEFANRTKLYLLISCRFITLVKPHQIQCTNLIW